MAFKKSKIKKISGFIIWVTLGMGAAFLLGAAADKNEQKKCTGININISGVNNHYFIDKNDVRAVISTYGGKNLVGQPVESFNLHKMEEALKKDIWIQDAEMFFDNNNILQAVIKEREPVARIFTTGGTTYYIDSSLMMLPLSEKFSARLPVFTGFPTEAKVLNRADSNLLRDVRNISTAIQEDEFLMGMIDQVDITEQRNFEMLPKMGNQLISFGDAQDIPEKFHKLKLFYRQVIVRSGWGKYSLINLQYKGQVVGKIRGADDVSADSLRTVQLMAALAANTERMADDSIKSFKLESEKISADSSMVIHSVERDESDESGEALNNLKPASNMVVPDNVSANKSSAAVKTNEPDKAVVIKPKVINTKVPAIKKPAVAVKHAAAMPKRPVEKRQPKAVMQPVKNDY